MDRCLEEISAAVLDAGESLSYRTLSVRSHVSPSVSAEALAQFCSSNATVKALRVVVTHASTLDADDSETAAARRDPRARTLRLSVEDGDKPLDVICSQIYALYSQPKASEDDTSSIATSCWAQERQTRNDVFSKVEKHLPLTTAAKALYLSGVACPEATARQDFGEEQGEETISAFDNIKTAKKSSHTNKTSFFKNSGKTGFKNSAKSSSKSESAESTPSKEVKVTADTMSNVLTIDSDDEEDDETDAPVFVKKSSSNGRSKRVISDDDDEEDEAPKKTSTPAPKSRNVKRKLNASPAETKKSKKKVEGSDEEESPKKKQCSDSEDDVVEVVPEISTKRQVLVTKTRINEQGYMVTEKTYEEVELTPEEIAKEKKAAQKKLEEKKKKAAAEKVAKAKQEAKKHSGPPKQRDLRSFFSVK